MNRYLEDEVREVNQRLREEEWKSLGLETRLVQMEACQQIMMERLDVMNVAPVVVDLTKRMKEALGSRLLSSGDSCGFGGYGGG